MIEDYKRVFLSPFLHRFTLIVGEINTGKTYITQRILNAYCRQACGEAIVVDLAPDIPPTSLKNGNRNIGGRMCVPDNPNVHYFHAPLHAPRLQGKNEKEIMALADENATRIESLFEEALPREIHALFINDCSLYLQAGKLENMLKWIRSAETAIVNGYHGTSLGTSSLSTRERLAMKELMRQCDRVIRLTIHESGREKNRHEHNWVSTNQSCSSRLKAQKKGEIE